MPDSPSYSNKLQRFFNDGGREALPTIVVADKKEPETVYSLTVVVSEAKDLVLEGVAGDLNSFVLLNLENAKKRTRTVKGINPFWSEPYTLSLLDPNISKLKVSLWNEGTKDKMLSMCEIPLYNIDIRGKEDWYDLSYGSSSSYVSGEIHVQVYAQEFRENGTIRVVVIEGRDLPLRTRAPQEFFTKITLGKSSHKTKSYKIQEKSRSGAQTFPSNPEWNETFSEIKGNPDDLDSTLTFSVYRVKFPGQRLVGQCSIPVSTLLERQYLDEWLLLEGTGEVIEKEKKKSKKLGSIRLSLKLTKAIVHHIDYYTPLVQLLMDSPESAAGSVAVLEKTIQQADDRSAMATCLVKIYESKNKAPMILKTLLTNEIANAPNTETLFRANSLASKSVDMYMKISCYSYLQYCVQPLIDTIIKETAKGKSCDVSSPEAKKNWKYAQKLLDSALERIYKSADQCPPDLRDIFFHIQESVQEKFPEDRLVKFIGVSGFLFLRFICPAILGPKLFDLASDHPNTKATDNLKQIAKIIQRIANMSPTQDHSDPVSNDIEKYVELQKQNMKRFLNQVSRTNQNIEFFNPASVDLQQELSFMQEHCEKNIDVIIQAFTDNSEISENAKQLLCILDKMNETSEVKRLPALIQNDKNEWILNPNFVSPKPIPIHSVSTPSSPKLSKVDSQESMGDKRRRKLKSVTSETNMVVKSKRKVSVTDTTPERERRVPVMGLSDSQNSMMIKSLDVHSGNMTPPSPSSAKKLDKKRSYLDKRKKTD